MQATHEGLDPVRPARTWGEEPEGGVELTPHSIERIAGTSASALSAVAKVQWNRVSPSQGRGNPCNILSLCELAVFSLSLRTICAVDLVSTGVMASGDCGGEDKKSQAINTHSLQAS